MTKEEKKEEDMDVDPSEVKNEEEKEMEAAEEEEEEDLNSYQLRVLPFCHDLHQKHGLRHNDYQRYRGYCSRRIARTRKAVKFVQGEKKKFTKKEVTLEIIKDPKFLLIPLMTTERAWAYAMQLKFEVNTEPRKKFHMINRLRKAERESEKLVKLVMAFEKCDARSKLECQAYHDWIEGTLKFELQNWREATVCLTKARTIYEKLSVTLGEDEAVIYKQRMADIVPSLRFCAYNSGDDMAKQDLLNMRAGGGLGVEELINQTREEQAATLQEVEWRGRKMAVKQEKVRGFLLREQEFSAELSNAENYESKLEAFESLLMNCKDAIQLLRDDLIEDPAFRNRQQTSEGPVTAMHFLYTYLSYIKHSKTIERNLLMIDHMSKILEGEMGETAATLKKPVKAQDLVRLYETIIQNLADMPQLAGLDEDLAFKHEIEAKVTYFKAWRCHYLAQSIMMAQKWSEAMALYQRATTYAKKAKGDKTLDANLRSKVDGLLSSIEGRQFMAHANSILDTEGIADKVSKIDLEEQEKKKKKLIDRLDEYYEDPDLVKGKPALADFPPAFSAIPCKPLFFDLAREQLTFPSLDDKLRAANAAQGGGAGGGTEGGASGGWLGGWLGGWKK